MLFTVIWLLIPKSKGDRALASSCHSVKWGQVCLFHRIRRDECWAHKINRCLIQRQFTLHRKTLNDQRMLQNTDFIFDTKWVVKMHESIIEWDRMEACEKLRETCLHHWICTFKPQTILTSLKDAYKVHTRTLSCSNIYIGIAAKL